MAENVRVGGCGIFQNMIRETWRTHPKWFRFVIRHVRQLRYFLHAADWKYVIGLFPSEADLHVLSMGRRTYVREEKQEKSVWRSHLPTKATVSRRFQTTLTTSS